MAMRDILDRQANSIEYVLHTHGIRAQIDGGRLSPRLAHYHLMLPPGVRASQLAPIVPEMADALGVVSCRLASTEEGAYVEVPRPDPVPVRLLPLVQRVADIVPPATATLGLDTEGTPLLLRLNSPDVDPIILSGSRGSGKSSLLRGMALSLALHNSPDNLRLLLLDATNEATFRGLETLPHLACPILHGPVESLLSLRWALRALSRRAHTSSADELFAGELFLDDGEDEPVFEDTEPGAEGPALVVMVDGADELCATGNRAHDAEAADALRRLLAGGNSQGIHIVISAERPEQVVNAATGWGARIVGRVPSPDAARRATGVKGSGAQGLLGAGDFLVALNAELIRFQAGELSEAEVAKSVDLIRSCARAQSQPQAEEDPVFSRPGPRALESPRPLRRGWAGK